MKTKFILILTAMLLTAASGYAKAELKDADESGSKFGIEAGYDHNWLNPSTQLMLSIEGGEIAELKEKTTINLDGFHAGFTYSYYFMALKGLYVNGSLFYQYARGNVKQDQIGALTMNLLYSYDQEAQLKKCSKFYYTMHNLEIPVRIGYNYMFDSGFGINVYVGPSFNFGLDWILTGELENGDKYNLHQLSGKISTEGVSVTKDADQRATYNVVDVALGGGIGANYKWIYLNLGCDWGLTNICKNSSLITTGEYEGKKAGLAYTNSANQVRLKLSIGFRF